MSEQHGIVDVSRQDVQVRVHLLRPSAGATIAVGSRINGIGWVVSDSPVSAVEIRLGTARPRRALLGLSAADLATLTGHAPSDAITGFVFTVNVPPLPPGPVRLMLGVTTARGHYDDDVELDVAATLEMSVPLPTSLVLEPIRATIEVAQIDAKGLLRVSGWTVSLSPIESLQVFLGTRLLGEAQRGMLRDDLAPALPDYPDAALGGFLLRLEVAAEDLVHSEVHLVVASRSGVERRFSSPIVRPEALQPRPLEPLAQIACEEVLLTDDGHFAIKGWAVASSGVAEIAVELDEAMVGTTLPAEARADVGNRYPRIPAARQAGFRLRRRLPENFSGDHVVRITVRGQQGEENSFFQVVSVQHATPEPLLLPPPAQASADEKAGDQIRCFLDLPACKDGAAIDAARGFLSLSGWAFGVAGIAGVDVFVDGVSQGSAHHGIRREDLQAAFPEDDGALLAGFAMVLPPQVMKPGRHAIRLDIRDKAGRVRELGFSILAEPPALGPGPWMLRNKLPQAEVDLQQARLAAAGRTPSWAVVLVASGGSEAAAVAEMRATLGSLIWQAAEWRVTVLARDEAAVARLETAVRALPDAARLHVTAIQPEARLADLASTADWVAVLGAGDRLGEDALLEMSLEAASAPGVDFLYADERRTDPADGQMKAFFKPDFSPELLLSTNYVGRFWAATPALLNLAGLLQGDLAALGDYDAVLRLTEASRKIGHVAKVLSERGSRGEPPGRERQALARALQRRSVDGEAQPGAVRGTWKLRRSIALTPAGRTPMVSIIMPTRGTRGLVETAIGSIRAITDWPSYEIVCLDDIPDGDAAQLRLKAWVAGHADVTLPVEGAFNWSRLNNRGAAAARGDILLFLNDDVEIRDPAWLRGLIEQASRPEIGVVGPQLLYPDGRVQHAGVFLGRRAARHAFRFYPANEPGPFGLALTQRDTISVTGACLMVRREVFDELAGFDEAHAVVNNDLDFCLRVRATGRSVIYTPAVSLIHHEMVSRAALPDRFDDTRFAAAWGDLFLRGDPFFSRHFSPDHDDYLPDAEPVRVFVAGRPLVAREKIRRIVVVKVDHIGDFITAFPALQRIKQHFPDAELTVLAARASLALAHLEPAIDRVIEFNFYHARSEKGRRAGTRRALASLRARLASEHFDLGIDLRRQPDTRPILLATGARWLAGFDQGYQHDFLDVAVEFEGDVERRWKTQHVTDSLVSLIDRVSAQCEPERRIIRDTISGRPARDAPIVCIHTGAGALNKQWPAAHFAGLIDLLIGELGARIVVIGGPDEAEFARDVIARARRGSAVIDRVGQTGLRELPDVLRTADLYVGNDSGPKHIAAALGVPTIGIHSGSVDSGEWGAVGPRAWTIRRDMVCSPCYLAFASDCHRGLACLDGIRVADVADACRKLLLLARPERAT